MTLVPTLLAALRSVCAVDDEAVFSSLPWNILRLTISLNRQLAHPSSRESIRSALHTIKTTLGFCQDVRQEHRTWMNLWETIILPTQPLPQNLWALLTSQPGWTGRSRYLILSSPTANLYICLPPTESAVVRGGLAVLHALLYDNEGAPTGALVKWIPSSEGPDTEALQSSLLRRRQEVAPAGRQQALRWMKRDSNVGTCAPGTARTISEAQKLRLIDERGCPSPVACGGPKGHFCRPAVVDWGFPRILYDLIEHFNLTCDLLAGVLTRCRHRNISSWGSPWAEDVTHFGALGDATSIPLASRRMLAHFPVDCPSLCTTLIRRLEAAFIEDPSTCALVLVRSLDTDFSWVSPWWVLGSSGTPDLARPVLLRGQHIHRPNGP